MRTTITLDPDTEAVKGVADSSRMFEATRDG